jgi:hypothetical protein
MGSGKTLPKVLVNLHEGGFAVYVAASCAWTHEDLCISRLVSIQQLNKLLPPELLQEVRRFDIIEHNTYIKHGFHQGAVLDVPDAEAERMVNCTKLLPRFDIDNPLSQADTKNK